MTVTELREYLEELEKEGKWEYETMVADEYHYTEINDDTIEIENELNRVVFGSI